LTPANRGRASGLPIASRALRVSPTESVPGVLFRPRAFERPRAMLHLGRKNEVFLKPHPQARSRRNRDLLACIPKYELSVPAPTRVDSVTWKVGSRSLIGREAGPPGMMGRSGKARIGYFKAMKGLENRLDRPTARPRSACLGAAMTCDRSLRARTRAPGCPGSQLESSGCQPSLSSLLI
jgi:hypothetical protein